MAINYEEYPDAAAVTLNFLHKSFEKFKNKFTLKLNMIKHFI